MTRFLGSDKGVTQGSANDPRTNRFDRKRGRKKAMRFVGDVLKGRGSDQQEDIHKSSKRLSVGLNLDKLRRSSQSCSRGQGGQRLVMRASEKERATVLLSQSPIATPRMRRGYRRETKRRTAGRRREERESTSWCASLPDLSTRLVFFLACHREQFGTITAPHRDH